MVARRVIYLRSILAEVGRVAFEHDLPQLVATVFPVALPRRSRAETCYELEFSIWS